MPLPRSTLTCAIAIVCVTAALGATPSQAAGDTLTIQAPTRVAEVTVYSDRARVLRRSSNELPDGMSTVDLGELPTNAFAQTVRVSAAGAAVRRVDVEVVPSLATRLARPEVDELIAKLEGLRDEAALLTRDVQVIDRELGLLASAHPQPVPPESTRLDAKVSMTAAPEQWGRVLDFVDARMATARKARAELAVKQRAVGESLAKLAAEAQRRGLDTSVRVAPRARAVLEPSHAGRVALELEYFVSEASWRPRYDVHFDTKSGVVKLLTSASVTQRSGEDWDEAKLHFSTAIPGQGVELPELLTWTIGEQRDFLPMARPAPGQVQPPRFPPPAPAAATALDRPQLALQQRLQRLATLAGEGVVSAQNIPGVGDSGASIGLAKATDARAASGASRAPTRSAPSPAPPAKMRQMSAAPSNAPAMLEEAEIAAPQASPAEPARRRQATAKPAPASGFALGLDEAPPPPSLTDPSLPAVAAGGLDYVWSASTASTVTSTGEAVTVPLDAQRYPVKLP